MAAAKASVTCGFSVLLRVYPAESSAARMERVQPDRAWSRTAAVSRPTAAEINFLGFMEYLLGWDGITFVLYPI
jgi:hypothetical protein